MRVKCLAQEHNTVSSPRAQTWTTQSVDERTKRASIFEMLTLSLNFSSSSFVIRVDLLHQLNHPYFFMISIIIFLVFIYLSKYYFQISFNLKVINFVSGSDNSK